MNKKRNTHPIVDNLRKIMKDRELGQNNFASLIDFPSSKLSKIFKGDQNMNSNDFSKIAISLNMREIDIITYPQKFREVEFINSEVKAQLTVELKDSLKADVLQLVFGNNNLELINK
jgi:predicted transcriptional regulator